MRIKCVVQHTVTECRTRRDLKPENVLVYGTGSDEHATLKVTDFGIAADLTVAPGGRMTEPYGSPEYAAPEINASARQNGDGGYGIEVDVWSLGVVAFFMLSGELPFEGEDSPTIRRKVNIRSCALPCARQLNSNGGAQVQNVSTEACFASSPAVWRTISAETIHFITSMLQKLPSKRPPAVELRCSPWFGELAKADGQPTPGDVCEEGVPPAEDMPEGKDARPEAGKAEGSELNMPHTGAQVEVEGAEPKPEPEPEVMPEGKDAPAEAGKAEGSELNMPHTGAQLEIEGAEPELEPESEAARVQAQEEEAHKKMRLPAPAEADRVKAAAEAVAVQAAANSDAARLPAQEEAVRVHQKQQAAEAVMAAQAVVLAQPERTSEIEVEPEVEPEPERPEASDLAIQDESSVRVQQEHQGAENAQVDAQVGCDCSNP